jgi:hypothetical protein
VDINNSDTLDGKNPTLKVFGEVINQTIIINFIIQGVVRMQKKEPKRKTSVYLDEENIETIKGFKDKYNLSLNRTINMCLTKYLPEMRVWI